MINTTNSFETDEVVYNQGFARVILPVRKGDIIRCEYTTNGSYNTLRFYYAEGDKPVM